MIKNACVLPLAGGSDRAESGDILVENGRIARIGTGIDAPGADSFDACSMIVMPGLVDAHLHTWQTGIRAIAGDWALGEYFKWVHLTLAPLFTPEDIYLANLVGALNQIDCGVTTLFDWNHNNPTADHTDRAIDGLLESGIRAVYGHGTPTGPADGQGEPLHPEDEVKRILGERLAGSDLVSLALCIRGPDLTTYETSAHDMSLARKYGLVASTHMGARPLSGRKTPDGVLRLAEAGLLGPDFNSVHSNKLSDEQIAVMAGAGVSFTVTPEVEMQMGHGIPVTGRVRAHGIQPSIGIDIETGIGSEMLGAARFAMQVQRGLDNDQAFEEGREVEMLSVRSAEALGWATIEGARAMRMEKDIGSLEQGKQADLIMIRADDLNLFAAADPAQGVLYHAHSGNVDSVMIAGRWVKRAGRLVYGDIDALKGRLAESGRRLLADAGLGAAG